MLLDSSLTRTKYSNGVFVALSYICKVRTPIDL